MDTPMTEKCFKEFLSLIHELTGISISANRTSMVEGRLRKRINALKLTSYEEYLKLVQSDKKEQINFIDLITTNETYFFRTPRIWDYIEKQFLPTWHKSHPSQVFTAWSAAASSGEEAHALGIICQSFKEKNSGFLYQIVGTDISQEMVELCKKGEYTGKSIETFRSSRPDQFQKHMKSCGNECYQASPEIRSRLRFYTHNLFKPLANKEHFDLVLIRNVLIYFKPVDQEKALSLIEPHLAKDGLLVIGESESLSHIATGFKHTEPLIYSLAKAS